VYLQSVRSVFKDRRPCFLQKVRSFQIKGYGLILKSEKCQFFNQNFFILTNIDSFIKRKNKLKKIIVFLPGDV
jgi:hypothetical protein